MELAGREAHIGNFSGSMSGAVEYSTFFDDGSADAGADGYGKERRDVLSGSEPVFAEGGTIGIVFDADREFEFFL